LHYPFRNVGIGTVGIGSVGIAAASPKVYVDESSDGMDKVLKSGDTMSGNLNMNGNRITGLPDSLPSS